MMKKITLLFVLLITSLGFSQEVLQDFETGGPRDPFGGAAFSLVTDPEAGGTRGQVALLTASSTGLYYQGINIDLTKNVDLTSNKTMTMDVYSTSAITIAPKVVAGVSGAPDSTTSATHTGSGWETLSFTFDKGYDGTVTANGQYAVLVIYYLWKADNSGFIDPAIDRTFYVDNISGIAAGAPPAAPEPTDAPTTPPTRAAGNVISLYGDAYGTAVGLTGVTWDNGSVAVEGSYAGNNALKITNGTGDFIGFDINGGSINATNMSHVHVDFWIAADYVAGQVLKVKLSNHANLPGTPGETSSIIKEAVPTATDVKKWFSLDLPLGTDVRNKIAQALLIYTNSATPPAVLYVDNFYLYNDGSLSTNDFEIAGLNVYPNPTQDSWTVKTQNIKMSTIQVFDILGKQVLSLKPEATEASINASQLKSGLYFAKINTANGSSSLKLVRQ